MFKSNKKLNILVYTLLTLAISSFGIFGFFSKVRADYEDYTVYYPTENPAPFVNFISPNHAKAGETIPMIYITGSGFVEDSIARWDGSPRRTTFIDSGHLIIHLNQSDLQNSNGRYINVYSPTPGGGYSNAILFSIEGYKKNSTVATDPNNYNYNNSNSGSVNTSNNTGSNTVNSDSNSNNNASNSSSDQSENATSDKTTEEQSIKNLAASTILGANTLMPTGLIQWILLAIVVVLLMLVVRRLFGFTDNYHATPLKHD